jgi:arylformamidase
MKASIQYNETRYQVDFSHPLDISIPLRQGEKNVNCFYAPLAEFSPVRSGDFIGSVASGAPVNFYNVRFNPHGNGTHTECVGHIMPAGYTINQTLKKFNFIAKLVSLFPTRIVTGDRLLQESQIREVLTEKEAEALIIRTLPNDALKLRTNYSGSNPPYLQPEAAAYIATCGVQHLLIDLPSVDREEDGGRLLAHRAFWKFPERTRGACTISELIYVDNSIEDGMYLLNLQIASFELDVSPSKPVLYKLQY